MYKEEIIISVCGATLSNEWMFYNISWVSRNVPNCKMCEFAYDVNVASYHASRTANADLVQMCIEQAML